MRPNLRAGLRALALAFVTLVLLVPALLLLALRWPFAPLAPALDRLATRALLRVQQLWSRGVLTVLGVHLAVEGAAGDHAAGDAIEPGGSLLVSNHLGYLDVPVLAALWPCRFVAKSEVAGWPVFGFLARVVGVLFIERSRPRDLLRVGEAVRASLADGLAVVVFPEGTSTRGDDVLPFHPGLLEPAVQAGVPCRALAIHYETPEETRSPSGTICWWGEMTFPPHLWSLMSIARIDARVRLAPRAIVGGDRKELAAALHAEVSALFRPVRQGPLAAWRAAPAAEEPAPEEPASEEPASEEPALR